MRGGPKNRHGDSVEARYWRQGFPEGLTIAEWEEKEGLPPYSVQPEAQAAAGPHDRGFFLYRNATEEERLILATRPGRPRLSGRDQRECERVVSSNDASSLE